MIKPGLKTITFALFSLFFFACKNSEKEEQTQRNDTVASVDNLTISLTEVDQQIQQQLYDQLYQVYLYRKRALEKLIDQKLLERFAAAKNMSVDSLLRSYVDEKRIMDAVAEYDSTKRGVVDIKRTIRHVPASSDEGLNLIRFKFIELARQHIVDSLKKTVPIKINLQPPTSPEFNNQNLDVTWLPQTNLKAEKEIILISDFECNHCREIHNVFSKLINKYRDKYKFGIVPYGSYATLYLTTCELVKPYNRFWETYDYLMKQPNYLDTAQILKFVSDQKIDTSRFRKEIYSETVKQKLLAGFQKVKDKGITATPSLLINGKLVYNAFSEEELERAINGEKN
jgi:hypothetical protein